MSMTEAKVNYNFYEKLLSQRSAAFFLRWLDAAESQRISQRWSEEEFIRARAYFESVKNNANAP